MTADFVIYRSTHPDVLAAYDAYQIAQEQWRNDWRAQVKAWGFDVEKNKPYVTNGVWGASRLIGVYWGYSSDSLPSGWKRVDSGSQRHVLEPYRSKPKGIPAIQEEFAKLVKIPDIRRDLKQFGMPQSQFVGLRVTTYGLTLVEQDDPFTRTIWIKWREVDPVIESEWWEQMPLSQYYAIVESGNDPFAKDEEPEDEG